MAKSIKAYDNRPRVILQGGPRSRWVYFEEDIRKQQAAHERLVTNGMPFRYRETDKYTTLAKVWSYYPPDLEVYAHDQMRIWVYVTGREVAHVQHEHIQELRRG